MATISAKGVARPPEEKNTAAKIHSAFPMRNDAFEANLERDFGRRWCVQNHIRLSAHSSETEEFVSATAGWRTRTHVRFCRGLENLVPGQGSLLQSTWPYRSLQEVGQQRDLTNLQNPPVRSSSRTWPWDPTRRFRVYANQQLGLRLIGGRRKQWPHHSNTTNRVTLIVTHLRRRCGRRTSIGASNRLSDERSTFRWIMEYRRREYREYVEPWGSRKKTRNGRIAVAKTGFGYGRSC